MSENFLWPSWVTRHTAGEDITSEECAIRSRFLLRYAALIATEKGTLSALSVACGLHPKMLPAYATQRCVLPAHIAAKVARACGNAVSLSMLRPDLAPDEIGGGK